MRTPLKLGACLLALATISVGSATAQETTLDYAKLTSYLSGKYGDKCKDKSTNGKKAFSCRLAGNEYRLVPFVEVNAYDDNASVAYSLSVRVGDPSYIENFDKAYQDTLGAISDSGNDMKSVAPNIYAAMRLCFEKSELGKNDRANCRYLPETGTNTRMAFFGDASDYFQLTLQTSKKK
ncbi:hypothetical protein [Mesorhizobium sp. 128a]